MPSSNVWPILTRTTRKIYIFPFPTSIRTLVAEVRQSNSITGDYILICFAAAKGKTAVTRKILVAQKTFANYIADEEALAALEPQPAVAVKRRVSNPALNRTASTTLRGVSSSAAPRGSGGLSFPDSKSEKNTPTHISGFSGHDASDARLLLSSVPAAPSAALLEALVNAPPLSYNVARAAPSSSGQPQRHFCEFCGYWGQVKCIKCGARVCGLVCKKAHDEERCQKYFG